MLRLTDKELTSLLDGIESDRAERKAAYRGDVPKKSRQAVCAFANDLPGHNQPGVLFIGAEDNGAPSGLAITEQLLLSLADMKTDGNILPLPVLSVEKRKLKGAEMAVVTGSPYGNVTSENFGQPGAVDYRNPNIADVLKTFGCIQAFGRGIAVARSAMKENGNPPLEFQTAVLCTLRGRS